MAQKKQRGAWQKFCDDYMAKIAQDPEVRELGEGVLYKVIASGEGTQCPQSNSVVTGHYRGTLPDGRVFDDSWSRQCPEAFRCRDLIPGFTAALLRMHIGDHWLVYIPHTQGYGVRNSGPIPGFSALTFEIQLINIG